MQDRLAIKALHTDSDVGGCFLAPLREASADFQTSLKSGQLKNVEGERRAEAAQMDLMILDDVLQRVERGVLTLAQR